MMDDVEWQAFSHYRNQIKLLNKRIDSLLHALKEIKECEYWAGELLERDRKIIGEAEGVEENGTRERE